MSIVIVKDDVVQQISMSFYSRTGDSSSSIIVEGYGRSDRSLARRCSGRGLSSPSELA